MLVAAAIVLVSVIGEDAVVFIGSLLESEEVVGLDVAVTVAFALELVVVAGFTVVMVVVPAGSVATVGVSAKIIAMMMYQCTIILLWWDILILAKLIHTIYGSGQSNDHTRGLVIVTCT